MLTVTHSFSSENIEIMIIFSDDHIKCEGRGEEYYENKKKK